MLSLLVSRVTCAFLLADWSFGGWKSAGKAREMAHTTKDKTELLQRARRIRGQAEAIERALASEHDCENVLNLIAACRGALSSLMVEIMEDHVRSLVMLSNGDKRSLQTRVVREFIDVIRPYLK